MEISYHQRKSRALGISMPTCLQGSGAGSLNVVRGCLFACAYCAWRAIPGSPQDHELLVYRDLAAQLREELDRADLSGRRPPLVLMNTGSDCFMGLPEVEQIAADCLAVLLERGIHVHISTKGVMARRTVTLLQAHASRVRITSYIPSVQDSFYARFEPNTPSLERRLAGIRSLVASGLDVRAKIEPIIPTENDAETELEELLRVIFRAGVRRVSASHLHVTEGVERRLRARLGPARCGLILRSYQRPAMVPSRDLRDGGEAPRAARPLRESRLEAYRVLHRLAARLGVVFTVCSCRNPDLDLPGEACYSIPPGASAPPRTPRRQLDLL